MYDGERLTWSEIQAYAELNQVRISPEEAAALKSLAKVADAVAAEALRENAKK